MFSTKAIAIGSGLAIVIPLAVMAQTSSQAPPPLRFGLGDMMTMTVQPRHIKLGLAGQNKNWTYAAYELHELEESLERVARYSPTWRNKPIADMIKSVMDEPVAALNAAIKASDSGKFDAAYKSLTDACNVCHQSAEQGFVVIKVPDASPYPDQDFRPAKP